MMVLRTLLMIPSAIAFLDSLPFLVELASDGVVDAVSMIALRQRHLAQLAEIRRQGRLGRTC